MERSPIYVRLFTFVFVNATTRASRQDGGGMSLLRRGAWVAVVAAVVALVVDTLPLEHLVAAEHGMLAGDTASFDLEISPEDPVDVAVVLGYSLQDGVPTLPLVARVHLGVRLFCSGRARNLLFSGAEGQDAGAFGGIHFASVCGPIDIRSFQIPANDGFSHRIEHAIARAALAWRNARFRSGGLQRKDTPRIPCCALSPDFKKARTRKKSKKFYRQIRKPETVKSISIVMDLGFQRGKLHFASYESDQILNLTGSRVETQS